MPPRTHRKEKPRSRKQHRPEPGTRTILKRYRKTHLVNLIAQAKNAVSHAVSMEELQAPDNKLTIFFSFTDGVKRATVVHFSGADVDEIWKKLAAWRGKLDRSPEARWLRVDWLAQARSMSWADCRKEIQSIKRNYFRYGLSVDPEFKHAFLEQELNANAMLYLGSKEPKAGINPKNFTRYGIRRFGRNFSLPKDPGQTVTLFTTEAFLFEAGVPPQRLHGYSGGKEGRNTGRRIIPRLQPDHVTSLIDQSSEYLADQVDSSGRFTYGIHPCFDREIKAYNTLRHASTTYAMLEAWEVTGSTRLKDAIDRSLTHLTNDLIHTHTLPSGKQAAFLYERNGEIKLGGNAVCLLALVKYEELTEDRSYRQLMERLGTGIQFMQDPESGQFHHVLDSSDLSVKETFRVIYYDGEAAFGLMRLYGITKDDRWINTVERAFDYFIRSEHWKVHDHWLSYCVNELTLHRPDAKYFEFGLKNVSGHLDFVIGRITTYPTLLELMMAAHKMIGRLRQSNEYQHLLTQIDLKKFYIALDARAHYLLNGFFWPEFAIYFKNPQRILGSFFIRHHSFRVRIDDVEHYVSGYCAYLQHYLESQSANRA